MIMMRCQLVIQMAADLVDPAFVPDWDERPKPERSNSAEDSARSERPLTRARNPSWRVLRRPRTARRRLRVRASWIRSVGLSDEDPGRLPPVIQSRRVPARGSCGGHARQRIRVLPEATVFTYSHAAFSVRQIIFVPVDEPAIVMLLDVSTTLPIRITAAFRPRLRLMWPAGLMTPYVSWDQSERVYALTEESRRFAGVVGSPVGRRHLADALSGRAARRAGPLRARCDTRRGCESVHSHRHRRQRCRRRCGKGDLEESDRRNPEALQRNRHSLPRRQRADDTRVDAGSNGSTRRSRGRRSASTRGS